MVWQIDLRNFVNIHQSPPSVSLSERSRSLHTIATASLDRAFTHGLLLTLLPHRRSRNRVNGTTQTFRRPSLATTPSQTRDPAPNSASTANNGGVYIPPHHSSMSRNAPAGETRYTKDQLLNIYQTLEDASVLDRDLVDIFEGTWNLAEDKNGTGNQGSGSDAKDLIPGPEVCWNYGLNPQPFGLKNMTEEEKQVSDLLFARNLRKQLILDDSFSRHRSIRLSSRSRPPPKRPPVWELLGGKPHYQLTLARLELQDQALAGERQVTHSQAMDRCHPQRAKPSSVQRPTPQLLRQYCYGVEQTTKTRRPRLLARRIWIRRKHPNRSLPIQDYEELELVP